MFTVSLPGVRNISSYYVPFSQFVKEKKGRIETKEILSAVGTKPGNVSAPSFFKTIVNFSKAKKTFFFMKDLYFLEKS